MLVLAAAAAVAALAWVYLLTCHGGFWRTDQRLPPGRDPASWPAVTVVVPARDEAAVLPATLPTLLAQDYPGKLRVILVDDNSSDGTAQVAEKLAAASGQPFQDLIRLVPAGQRPDGWAGKVWAMECGLAAAGQPEYVLFTDADISYAPGTLTALVRAADGGGYGLVSQMALLRTETAWERLIVPAFVYFFAQLYPFRRVNRPRSRTAAAAGGCMLVRRETLAAAGGLAMIRGARIDDVALGRVLKGAGARCWLGLTTDVHSRRPYPSLAGLWDMVARSAYTQLRYSPLLLAGTLAGLAWLYLLPPAAAIAGLAATAAGGGPAALVTAAAGISAWALLTASYVPMQRLYGLPAVRALALPFAAALYGAMTFDSARRHWAGRGGEWKGRTI
ncbi:MAG TPA: glycosyltransferase [Streptosporangiaceae bacterium]|jgi:hopene-associated glycosyltransferase HpnB|nr:glycosyltransferase [Streptosporangiaceae bacterium]